MITARPRFHLRFFWQLTLAFSLIILLVGGGMFFASQLIFNSSASSGETQVMRLWNDRLTSYYARQNTWQGVEAMLVGYPCGTGWEPWDQSWSVDYLLAGTNGTILSASDVKRVGQPLSLTEQLLAVPMMNGNQKIGSLLVLSREEVNVRFAPGRLLAIGLVIACVSLGVGVVLSRRISQPLADLTTASRAIATGTLDVRVSARYAGEAGELVESFNQMAEDLAQADHLRRNLTADVAHELRTPLSIIRAKLEGILDGVYPATPEHVTPVLETVNLLTQLVEDLRLLALADARQLALEKKPTNLADLLRDAEVNFGPQAADRSVTLVLDLPTELPEVLANQRRIAQVLGNLLTNALRYTPASGQVTLAAAAMDQGIVEITVADTGPGIAPEDLAYVFERFWRGEKSRSRLSGGSGLGLAIARRLIEMHGGDIRVDSVQGQGATFRFTLPVRSDQSPCDPPTHCKRCPTSNRSWARQ